MIKLGVNSVLFGAVDFATAARQAKLCGYDGIEVSAIAGMCEHLVLDHWYEQAGSVREIAEENGLRLLSMEVASLDEVRLEKAFAAGRALGIPVINVGPGGKSGEEPTVVESLETLARRADLAAHYGVTLCCKAHVGAAIHDTPTTLRMMKTIPADSFGVDMDPSHIWRAGEQPEVALDQVISRVRHVHIRDCKGRQMNPGIPMMQACGRGDIDLAAYLKALVRGGYDGPVCLEVIGAGALPLDQTTAIAAESYGFLNAVLKSLGAR